MNLTILLLAGIGVFVFGVMVLGLLIGKISNRRHHNIDLRRERRRETVEYTEPEPVSEPEPEEDTAPREAAPHTVEVLPEYRLQFRSKPGRTSPRPYYMPPQEADAANATNERYL